MELLYLLIAFVIGGVVGGVIMSLRKSGVEALRIELAKLQSEKEAQADKEEWVEKAEEKLREAFDSLAGKSLRHNAEAFLKQAQTQMTGVLNEVRGDWKTQKTEMQNLMSPVRDNFGQTRWACAIAGGETRRRVSGTWPAIKGTHEYAA